MYTVVLRYYVSVVSSLKKWKTKGKYFRKIEINFKNTTEKDMRMILDRCVKK